jgi:hypothetical protein
MITSDNRGRNTLSRQKYAPPLLSDYPKTNQRSTKIKEILKDGIKLPKTILIQDPSKITLFLDNPNNSNNNNKKTSGETVILNDSLSRTLVDFCYDKNASIACKILENNKLRFSFNNAAFYENDVNDTSPFDNQLITASLIIGFSTHLYICFCFCCCYVKYIDKLIY